MSYYAALDGRDVGDVATNSGMHDFSEWVTELEGAEALRYLTEYGESEDLEALETELAAALESADPTPDQRSIGEGLLAILRNRGNATVLIISDGVGEGEGEAEVERG